MKYFLATIFLLVLPVVLGKAGPLSKLLNQHRQRRSAIGFERIGGYEDINRPQYGNAFRQPVGYRNQVYDREKESLKNQVDALNRKVTTLEKLLLEKDESQIQGAYKTYQTDRNYDRYNDIYDDYDDLYDQGQPPYRDWDEYEQAYGDWDSREYNEWERQEYGDWESREYDDWDSLEDDWDDYDSREYDYIEKWDDDEKDYKQQNVQNDWYDEKDYYKQNTGSKKGSENDVEYLYDPIKKQWVYKQSFDLRNNEGSGSRDFNGLNDNTFYDDEDLYSQKLYPQKSDAFGAWKKK